MYRGNKNKSYYLHDDRGGGGNFSKQRHVSFHPQSGSIGKKRMSRQRERDKKIRSFLDDGDVDMNVRMNRNNRGHNFRYTPFDPRNKPIRNQQFKNNRRMLSPSTSGWYRVTLCHGKKYVRQDVMKALQSYIQPVPFVPVGVTIEEDDMIFYVDNQETAQAIYEANLRVQMRDGWKMQIKVNPKMPCVELNVELREKIRAVMSSKYDPLTQRLDLSRFHANEEFRNNDLFVPLNRPNMLLAVFQIISESVPNLRILNLSDNKIFSIEHFIMLRRNAPNLKSLDLSKNKISDLSKLECLQGLRLEILILDENPLCDKFQDQTTYVREVRKIFRTLLHLDGVDLPPPVSFDNEETPATLPQSHGSFLCSEDGRAFTRQFLEQYYAMYDNQISRDPIAEAYADNAQFSMSAYVSAPGTVLNKYLQESRNLKKVNHYERRSKLLHVGKSEIIRFLSSLPKTQHDLPSFTVDLTTFRPELISLTLCGVFRETSLPLENNRAAIRSFSRTFVLVPTGSGFNIVNDMLTITNASSLQMSTTFQPQQQQQQPPVKIEPQPVPEPLPAPVNSLEEAELNRKREMVATFTMQTGMNLMWSEKCLAETNWDFNNALYAFNEFNKLGKIPPEAFIK